LCHVGARRGITPAQTSAGIDWSKVLCIDYVEGGGNKTFAIATAADAVDIPIAGLGNLDETRFALETAFALHLACNAFCAANTGLSPSAPRWKQVRDLEFKVSMTCFNAQGPAPKIRQGWGGR